MPRGSSGWRRRASPQADLDRIDGPVGLDIGAIGPSEIALSIAAAMVDGKAFHDRALSDTVLVLLAAGRSQRFGDGNKLDEEFLGKPLGLHVAIALESDAVLASGSRWSTAPRSTMRARGLRVVQNPDPRLGHGAFAAPRRACVAQASGCRSGADRAGRHAARDGGACLAAVRRQPTGSIRWSPRATARSPCPPALFGSAPVRRTAAIWKATRAPASWSGAGAMS